MYKKIFIFLIFSIFVFSQTLKVDKNASCIPIINICSGCQGIGFYYTKIKDALNAAQNGDTIKICPGEYDENNLKIDVDDLNITSTTTNKDDVKIVSNTNRYIFYTTTWHSGVSLNYLTLDQKKNRAAVYINGIAENWSFNNLNITSKNNAIQFKKNVKKDMNFTKVQIITQKDGIRFDKQSQNVYIENCEINAGNGYGIVFKDKILGDSFTINDLNITSKYDSLYFVKDIANSISINKLNIVSSSFAIRFKGKLNHGATFDKMNITADNRGLSFYKDISGDINISECNITSSSLAIKTDRNVYDNFYVENCEINASGGYALQFKYPIHKKITIINNKIYSTSDALKFEQNINNKIVLKNNCIFSDHYVFYFKNNVNSYEITNNCFSNTAKSSSTIIYANNNYWDDAIGGSNVYDSAPLSVCPLDCFKVKLVAEWRMDECEWSGTENEVGDNSGNENNGTAKNDTNTSGEAVLCRSGNFNADNNQTVDIPASDTLTINDKISYVTWIKLKDPNYIGNSDKLENIFTNQTWKNALRYTEKGYDNNGNESNKILFQLSINGNEKYLYSNTSINDTDWHHIAAVYDGKYMRIYIDGNEDANLSVNGQIDTDNADNIIAGEYGDYYFNGYIDELKVFDGALSSDKVESIYNNEKNGKNWDGSDRTCNNCGSNNNDKNSTFNAVDYITGSQCNALSDWDDNITTKIVNKEFNLTILAKDPNMNVPLEANITKVELYFYSSVNNGDCSGNLIDKKVICTDCGLTNMSGCLSLDNGIKIDKASKCVKVHIEGKALYNIFNDTNESNSTDNFAVRPNRFLIYVLSSVKSAREFNITLKAVDINGNPVKDYNETVYINGNSVDLEYNETKANCKTGTLSKIDGGEFKNGEANITLKYDETGELNLTLKEVNASEYARVDNDDTNLTDRFINSGFAHLFINPDHFEIKANFVNYDTDYNFTYYDEDLNISSHLEINITAKNKDNQVVSNYNKECYAKDITLNIKHNEADVNVSKIIYEYVDMSNNIFENEISKENNISFVYAKSNFTTDNNGSTKIDVYFNFDRNVSLPVDPLEFNITNIDVNDSDINGSLVLGESARYFYGNLLTDDITTSQNDINKTFSFIIFASKNYGLLPSNHEMIVNWFYNISHQLKDGNVSDSDIIVASDYNSSNSINGITVNVMNISDGNITFNIKRNDLNVNFAVIHLLSPNLKWLWYSRYGDEYNISAGSTCLNHFCFSVTWRKINENGEVGSGGFSGTEANVTDTNSTKRGVKIFR